MAQEEWNLMYCSEAAQAWSQEREELRNVAMLLVILDKQFGVIREKVHNQFSLQRKQLESNKNKIKSSKNVMPNEYIPEKEDIPEVVVTPKKPKVTLMQTLKNIAKNKVTTPEYVPEPCYETSKIGSPDIFTASPSILVSSGEENGENNQNISPKVDNKNASPKIKKNRRYRRYLRFNRNKEDTKTIKKIYFSPKNEKYTSETKQRANNTKKLKLRNKQTQNYTLTQIYKTNNYSPTLPEGSINENNIYTDNDDGVMNVDSIIKMMLEEPECDFKNTTIEDNEIDLNQAIPSKSQIITQKDESVKGIDKALCRACENLGMPCTKHRTFIPNPIAEIAENTFEGFWDMDFTLNQHATNTAQSNNSTLYF